MIALLGESRDFQSYRYSLVPSRDELQQLLFDLKSGSVLTSEETFNCLNIEKKGNNPNDNEY
jgi:hypothetical protein